LEQQILTLSFPVILKRADADRGIDNFKVKSAEQAAEILGDQEEESLWIIQDFVPNDGFYLVSIYHGEPVFSIFRTLEERPDHNELKAHMYKPKGGLNATLIEIAELPASVRETSVKAAAAMNRQIASVDSIYVPSEDKTYVLEVNYNPQLVTIETFKEKRQEVFLDAISKITG
jgi:glutathione synthase/RimK-type ligase-like ATP-grasp enzyme